MTEASLALQKAIRVQLIASAGVTALVPAGSIFDRHMRPEVFPCVIIGEAQVVEDDAPLARNRVTVFADLHCWTAEPGLAECKGIAGAVRTALRSGRLAVEGHHMVDLKVAGSRFMRDPGGQHGHAVVTVEAILTEVP